MGDNEINSTSLSTAVLSTSNLSKHTQQIMQDLKYMSDGDAHSSRKDVENNSLKSKLPTDNSFDDKVKGVDYDIEEDRDAFYNTHDRKGDKHQYYSDESDDESILSELSHRHKREGTSDEDRRSSHRRRDHRDDNGRHSRSRHQSRDRRRSSRHGRDMRISRSRGDRRGHSDRGKKHRSRRRDDHRDRHRRVHRRARDRDRGQDEGYRDGGWDSSEDEEDEKRYTTMISGGGPPSSHVSGIDYKDTDMKIPNPDSIVTRPSIGPPLGALIGDLQTRQPAAEPNPDLL